MTVEVGVRQLRENLREYLDRAEAGEEVVVTERGRRVARILPASGETTYERLVREGRITPAKNPRRRDLPPPLTVRGTPLTDALLEQRRERGC